MNELRVRVTKKSLLAGAGILIPGTVILLAVGVDPVSYLAAVIAGMVGAGAVVAFIKWRKARRLARSDPRSRGDRRP